MAASSFRAATSSKENITAAGLSVIREPEGEATLDVVFVHGFTGHPVRTWCHNKGSERPETTTEPPAKARKLNPFSKPHDPEKTAPSRASVYWPQDLLPQTLPKARVLTFGYDTNIRNKHVGPALNKSTVYDMAKGFLVELEAVRRLNASRPLLFVAHSLGGIMVKEALRQAHNNRNQHLQLKRVFDSTIGIIFFGTPHQGSDPRGLLLSVVERLARGLGFEANQHVVNTLLPDSECRQLRDEFNPVLQDQDWIIYSFQEGVVFPGLGRKVVENDSSYLNFPRTEITQTINRDHREMCRFLSIHDVEYGKVKAALDHIEAHISQLQSTSSIAAHSTSLGSQATTHADSLDEQNIKALLDSLRFEQIDSRQESIRMAHKNTCSWILRKREYKDWLDTDKLGAHHGFLWMKGHPGSGKSTLMKSTLRSFQRSKGNKGTAVIHFFFNARGDELEKTTEGMYRSLLLQLLEKMPQIQKTAFESAGIKSWNAREDRAWPVAILEELFEQSILSLGQQEVACFIDALDECKDDQVEQMVTLLEGIGEQAVSKGLYFRIFFSSRHYPEISLKTCLNLDLDQQDGHAQDIETYIESQLRVGDQQTKEQLRERASGVFMWVVLVVEILNKEKRKGTPPSLVTKRLKEIPKGLYELFRSILTRDQKDSDGLLLCIQWLLFTREPLGPEQLYCALLSGLESDGDSESDGGSPSKNEGTSIMEDAAIATLPDIQRFIRNTSKGLAEVTKSTITPVVQFIHESVRDFLLKDKKKGLREVWPQLGDNFEAQSHEKLKQCCFKYYMQRDISANLGIGLNMSPKLPKASSKEGSALWEKAMKDFPFLNYATRNILWHSEYAQLGAVSQRQFLEDDFYLRTWLLLRNVLEKHQVRRYNYTYTASLLYVLAELNLPALIKISLPALNPLAIIVTENERYGSPLLAAIVFKSQGAIGAFVDHLAAFQQIPASTVQKWRLETKKVSSFSTNFRFSGKRDIFSYVAEFGDMALVHLICKILGHKVDINTDDKDRTTPLWYAVGAGHAAVVKFLCQEGADPNATDKDGVPPISYAAQQGHIDVVRVLSQEGVNIEASCRHGRTPVSYAAKRGHIDVVKFLHEKGADINKRDRSRRTPISLASERGHAATVAFLLQEGADFNAGDRDKQTPIMFAAWLGCLSCFKLLVDSGSDLQARDNGGTTLLMFAVEGGNQKIVELLLEKGASVKEVNQQGQSAMAYTQNNQGSFSLSQFIKLTGLNNPHWTDDGGTSTLKYAVEKQDFEAEKSLLKPGRLEANLRDKNGQTPLHWAVIFNSMSLTEFLLNSTATELDVRDKSGRTPLSYAARQGAVDYVELLLESGRVETDSKDNDGRTPLSYATTNSGRYIKVMRLLLDTGKAQVDSRDNNGRTPLSHAASYHYNADIVKILLNAENVDINSKDGDGRSALSWAAGCGHVANVEAFLSMNGVEVDARDTRGRTPLMQALHHLNSIALPIYEIRDYLGVVAALLKTGRVNVDLVDDTGCTALDIAAEIDNNFLAQKDWHTRWWVLTDNRVVGLLKAYKEGQFKGLPDRGLLGLWD